METPNELSESLRASTERLAALRGCFDYAGKKERLAQVTGKLEDAGIWDTPSEAQALGRERARLQRAVESLDELQRGIDDTSELLELARAEDDAAALAAVSADAAKTAAALDKMEFSRMFSGEADGNNAFVDIQAGSGGTEAQDWAEMLLRMYLRWGDEQNYKTELVEKSDGDVAGVKSATLKMIGEFAYGYLRTETGVHRLVRKSPFDSGNRRHTSFASVYVYPEIDETFDVEINPADLRVDTYRASGAGGQHVNRTDSAVRITHAPSGIVVQCQNDRSQHRNRAEAMAMLKSRLFQAEMQKRREQQQSEEENKASIGWGSQIRSYVLDQSRIKDLRTGVESGNTQAVLDGALGPFIEASLKA
ncbi:MAG: peptide chain release factor 2, partial [Gammaproteobacteria bacterium]|nr:peptide chain release factor 2 [Gammaproteobacteria bacterium]